VPSIFSSIGFAGRFIEAAATAIGTGVVVGGFVGATVGMAYGWSRRQVEGNALRDGYIGALLTVAAWLIDVCIVYVTSL
jgi:hypothetical protein